MKTTSFAILGLLAATIFAGCGILGFNYNEEYVLSKAQQESYLSDTRPPSFYGFNAFTVEQGIDFRGFARLHPNHLASFQFLRDNIPVVKMRGRSSRSKMNVLLDTSSAVSWMELSKSEQFDARFLGFNNLAIPYRGGFDTGNVDAYAGVVSQLRIDQLFLENVPFYIRMAKNSLGPQERGIRQPRIDAVLGYDNLRVFEYIRFDPHENVVSFSSTIPYVPHKDLLMTSAPITNVDNHGLAVKGEIDGKSFPIILDFAGDYSFSRGDVKVGVTKQVSLGEVVYRQVPTLLLPETFEPPYAGRKMLEQYIVTICPRKNVVYFERLPEEE